jgi:hypothetical protein
MPWGDWQFWVVTLAAIAGLYTIARILIPKRKTKFKATLTIGGEPAKSSRKHR